MQNEPDWEGGLQWKTRATPGIRPLWEKGTGGHDGFGFLQDLRRRGSTWAMFGAQPLGYAPLSDPSAAAARALSGRGFLSG
jgi:hypothetical protein